MAELNDNFGIACAVIVAGVAAKKTSNENKCKRRLWTQPWLEKRLDHGAHQ